MTYQDTLLVLPELEIRALRKTENTIKKVCLNFTVHSLATTKHWVNPLPYRSEKRRIQKATTFRSLSVNSALFKRRMIRVWLATQRINTFRSVPRDDTLRRAPTASDRIQSRLVGWKES